MLKTLDPNEFVDTDEVFPDDYNPEDGITLATFTIVPGDQVNHAALSYKEGGHYFLGGSTRQEWAISLYQGYHYNGQDIPIGRDAAKHILETISGTTNFEEYDWAAQDWTYFE